MSEQKVLSFENPTNEDLLTALRVCGSENEGCRVCPLFKSEPCSNLFDVVSDRIAQQAKRIERETERNKPRMATRSVATEKTKDPAGGGLFGKGVNIWFCPKCGIFNTPSHKFCWACGQALEFDIGTEKEDSLRAEGDVQNDERS